MASSRASIQVNAAPEFLLLGCLVAMSEPAKVDGPRPICCLRPHHHWFGGYPRPGSALGARSPVAQVMQNDWSKGARIEEADRVKAASSSRGSAAAWSPAAQAPPGPRFLVESTHSAARRLAQRLRDVEASPQRPLRCCAT
jgi:hypothetical protein